ncbi:MAG: prepilin-type N-terminal cleavage/methylation domain-containing protein [Acidobacteriota bacterium]|jgi:prepilin-type N-terminal cleavage/methylation domain-containing protein|nr:prepilin-type N-terminal cleavage/methylation domain-containing protein [Acidobacteriota bacterium]
MRHKSSGFSLVELMVVMALSLVILGGVYMLMMQFGQSAQTENARISLQQEARYILSSFTTELKNAGSILSIANSGAFLGAAPHFVGVIPLNNTSYPDGVILASGDPIAVTSLTNSFSPSGATTLSVKDTTVDSAVAIEAWKGGDKGIVVATDGYYVFEVDPSTPPTASTLTVRGTSVYHSGLLNMAGYQDSEPATTGDQVTYPVDAPVVRLASFSIYVFRDIYSTTQKRMVRQLLRITDARGDSDPVANNDGGWGVVSENIYDLQLAYTAYPNWPEATGEVNYFDGVSANTLDDLKDDLRLKRVKQVAVWVVALTDEFGGVDEAVNQVPALADAPANTLPAGKYRYKLFRFNVEPRNYNVAI